VPDEPLVARLTARRQCPQCKKIYNVQSQPPRVEGVCDDDGARLDTREDDREAVIRDRLRAYRELTGPVLAWFGASGVHTVDGSGAPAEVWREIERVVLAAQQPLEVA
jgi:adenylate kinase